MYNQLSKILIVCTSISIFYNNIPVFAIKQRLYYGAGLSLPVLYFISRHIIWMEVKSCSKVVNTIIKIFCNIEYLLQLQSGNLWCLENIPINLNA
jgi:hypothetical protein